MRLSAAGVGTALQQCSHPALPQLRSSPLILSSARRPLPHAAACSTIGSSCSRACSSGAPPPPRSSGLQGGRRLLRRQQARQLRTALSKDIPLGGSGEEGDGVAAAVARPAFSLSSPYDKEIFALAIPALFSVSCCIGPWPSVLPILASLHAAGPAPTLQPHSPREADTDSALDPGAWFRCCWTQ